MMMRERSDDEGKEGKRNDGVGQGRLGRVYLKIRPSGAASKSDIRLLYSQFTSTAEDAWDLTLFSDISILNKLS
jgi:hypothetical protein